MVCTRCRQKPFTGCQASRVFPINSASAVSGNGSRKSGRSVNFALYRPTIIGQQRLNAGASLFDIDATTISAINYEVECLEITLGQKIWKYCVEMQLLRITKALLLILLPTLTINASDEHESTIAGLASLGKHEVAYQVPLRVVATDPEGLKG